MVMYIDFVDIEWGWPYSDNGDRNLLRRWYTLYTQAALLRWSASDTESLDIGYSDEELTVLWEFLAYISILWKRKVQMSLQIETNTSPEKGMPFLTLEARYTDCAAAGDLQNDEWLNCSGNNAICQDINKQTDKQVSIHGNLPVKQDTLNSLTIIKYAIPDTQMERWIKIDRWMKSSTSIGR